MPAKKNGGGARGASPPVPKKAKLEARLSRPAPKISAAAASGQASGALDRAAGIDRFVDDPADGPGAPSTFGTATEAAVDFAGAARCAFGCDRADLLVGNHVARTHDHDALSLIDR
jgi:hypothetical protein